MNRNKIKLSTIAVVVVLVGIVSNITPQFSSKAEGDEVLSAIVDYKNWTKITKEPVKVELLAPGVDFSETDFTSGVGISANG
jgi:uncharacterized membrane protein YvbJ